ncbi:MAG: YggS family pyridoxal phosphate-dependent enzyme [Phycisphaerales bacterium]|nr:YggS family pyridoxal phosphate-dependent enzyme [Phycisphaerales bacterium]
MRRRLQDNLKFVRQRIADACTRSGRLPDEVHLVAVTKSVGLDVIRTLLDLGVTEIGENRVQELVRRAGMIHESLDRRQLLATAPPPAPHWHMVGNLQRNKVKPLIPWTSMIHSVDRLRLAEDISKCAAAADRRVDILLEVNGGNEPQKQGAAVCAAPHLAEQIASLPGVRLRGLMTMAPQTADESALRQVFTRVGELFDEMRSHPALDASFNIYSAGMSADFETAIACGANLVRIGTALFEGIDSADDPLESPAAATQS